MASEKGATYLDKLCHKFYDEPKGHGARTDYVCRLCGGPLEAYYCEERLYLVRCVDCGTLALVKTTSPGAAAGVTLARPTISAVPVVRCQECTHYKICDEWKNGKRMLCEIHHHSYLDHDGDNHFCSWGQRKIETVLPKSDAKDECLE